MGCSADLVTAAITKRQKTQISTRQRKRQAAGQARGEGQAGQGWSSTYSSAQPRSASQSSASTCSGPTGPTETGDGHFGKRRRQEATRLLGPACQAGRPASVCIGPHEQGHWELSAGGNQSSTQTGEAPVYSLDNAGAVTTGKGLLWSFEASWASYSESLLQLLEQFKTRQETLEKLDKAQLEWTEQLRTVSGQIKKATSESSDTQDIESSGSEEMDEDVEDAETCAARQEQKRQQVAGQHAQILSALQKVQQSAREGASRREGSRTPRRKAEQSQSHGIHRQGSRRPGWQQAVFLLGSYACLSDVCEPFHPERSHSVQAELDFVDLLHAQFYACALTLTVAQPQLYPSLFDPRVPACDPAGSAEAHAGGPARLLSTFQVPPSMMATAGVEPDEVGGRCAPFSASPACCSNRPGILKHVQSHVQSGRLCRQVTFSSSPRIHLFHPSDRLPPAVPITEVCLLHAFFLALAGANAIERNGRDHTAQKGCPRQFYPKSRTSRHYQGRSCAGLARGAPSSTGLQRTCASVPMGNAAERAFYCIYGF